MVASEHIPTAEILGNINFLGYVVNTYVKFLELMCRNSLGRINSLVLQWLVWAKNPNQNFTHFKADSIVQQQHNLRTIFCYRIC